MYYTSYTTSRLYIIIQDSTYSMFYTVCHKCFIYVDALHIMRNSIYCSFWSNTIIIILYYIQYNAPKGWYTQNRTQAHLKVKGVEEPLGGVNIVYSESVLVVPVAFPVGVSSQVHSVTELAQNAAPALEAVLLMKLILTFYECIVRQMLQILNRLLATLS